MPASGFSLRNGLRFQADTPLDKKDTGWCNFAGWSGCCRGISHNYGERWSCHFLCGRLTAMGTMWVAVVFRGDQGVHHVGRNLVQSDPPAIDAPVLEWKQHQSVQQHQRGKRRGRAEGVLSNGAREATKLRGSENGGALEGRGHGGSLTCVRRATLKRAQRADAATCGASVRKIPERTRRTTQPMQ